MGWKPRSHTARSGSWPHTPEGINRALRVCGKPGRTATARPTLRGADGQEPHTAGPGNRRPHTVKSGQELHTAGGTISAFEEGRISFRTLTEYEYFLPALLARLLVTRAGTEAVQEGDGCRFGDRRHLAARVGRTLRLHLQCMQRQRPCGVHRVCVGGLRSTSAPSWSTLRPRRQCTRTNMYKACGGGVGPWSPVSVRRLRKEVHGVGSSANRDGCLGAAYA